MRRLGRADQDRADGKGAGDDAGQLQRGVAGVEIGENQHIGFALEARTRQHALASDPRKRGVRLHLAVDFELRREKPPLIIPAPALVANADGTQVATVQDGKVHFVKVELGNDSGNEVEIVDGLAGDQQIIATPGERIVEGVEVKVIGDDAAKLKP